MLVLLAPSLQSGREQRGRLANSEVLLKLCDEFRLRLAFQGLPQLEADLAIGLS